MAAGDTRVADLVDTVHNEIDSTICSHCVYNRTTCPREGGCWPIHMMNLQYVAVIKGIQIIGRTPSEVYSKITWYYIT